MADQKTHDQGHAVDTTAKPIEQIIEAEFHRIFGWVTKAGKLERSPDGNRSRWTRDGWIADNTRTSPLGPFKFLWNGFGVVVYLRPERKGIGVMKRIDFRLLTTAESFMEATRHI